MKNKRGGQTHPFPARIAAKAFFTALWFIVSLASDSCMKHSPKADDSEESLQVFSIEE